MICEVAVPVVAVQPIQNKADASTVGPPAMQGAATSCSTPKTEAFDPNGVDDADDVGVGFTVGPVSIAAG